MTNTQTDTRPTGDQALLGPVGDVLALVRRAKTEAKVSQRALVDRVTITASGPDIAAVRAVDRRAWN